MTRKHGVQRTLPGSHGATVHSTSAEGFNSRELRNALGSFATGVTIITTRSRVGKLHGMTANSFTSVSLTPPLVLWSSSLYAQSLPAFQEGTHFVVNILALRPDRAVEQIRQAERRQIRRCRPHHRRNAARR